MPDPLDGIPLHLRGLVHTDEYGYWSGRLTVQEREQFVAGLQAKYDAAQKVDPPNSQPRPPEKIVEPDPEVEELMRRAVESYDAAKKEALASLESEGSAQMSPSQPLHKPIASDDEIERNANVERGFQRFKLATGEGGQAEATAAPPGSEPTSEEERQEFLKKLDEEREYPPALVEYVREENKRRQAKEEARIADLARALDYANRQAEDRARSEREAREFARRLGFTPINETPPTKRKSWIH